MFTAVVRDAPYVTTTPPKQSGSNGLIPHVPLDLWHAANDHRAKLGAVPGAPG
jgi:hypothetical protein